MARERTLLTQRGSVLSSAGHPVSGSSDCRAGSLFEGKAPAEPRTSGPGVGGSCTCTVRAHPPPTPLGGLWEHLLSQGEGPSVVGKGKNYKDGASL